MAVNLNTIPAQDDEVVRALITTDPNLPQSGTTNRVFFDTSSLPRNHRRRL